MPRLVGVVERRAVIVAVPVGCEIPTYPDGQTLVTSLVLLPSKDYRPPGHPDRCMDLGPVVSIEVGDRPGYFPAPALVHMDRYSVRHYSTIEASESFGAAVKEMVALAKAGGLPLIDGNGEPVQPAEFFWRCRSTALEARPIMIPVRQRASVVSDKPYDGIAILEMIYARDVC